MNINEIRLSKETIRKEGLATQNISLGESAEKPPVDMYVLSFSEIQPSDESLVGGKAFSLARLYKAGLPVPAGFSITTAAYDFYVLHHSLPLGLGNKMETLRNELGGKVALRSSATCEDGEKLSMAGVFATFYIQGDSMDGYAQKIYDQSKSEDVTKYMDLNHIDSRDIKMGLVLQELIDPDMAGVIYTGVNGNQVLVQYVDGFGESLVNGEDSGSAVILDGETGHVQESKYLTIPLSKSVREQLVKYAAQIQNLFGGKNQDIEFACKNGQIYILQARTLTRELNGVELSETLEDTLRVTKKKLQALMSLETNELGTDSAVFSDSNYSELLPKPTEMDFGIFAYIFTGSDGVDGAIQLGRKEMGYVLKKHDIEYTHFIGGRPYFSLAMDALTYYAGFPDSEREYLDTLVNEYLRTAQEDPKTASYPEMGLYLQDPTIDDLRQRYGIMGDIYYQIYQDFKDRMGNYAGTFQETFIRDELPSIDRFISDKRDVNLNDLTKNELVDHITSILEHLRTVSCVDFVKAARLGFYYSQRVQALLGEIPGISKEEIEQVFSKLSQGLDGSTITIANIEIANASSDHEAYEVGKEKVGHYSTKDMLEVRHQRLKDNPNALQAYVAGIRQAGNYEEAFESQKEERLKTEDEIMSQIPTERRQEAIRTIRSMQTYMSLRETVKYHFAREYDLIRDALELIGQKAELKPEEIYHLFPRELIQFITDPEEFRATIVSRKRHFKNYDSLNMPTAIRDNDVESLGLDVDEVEDFEELEGNFIAEGEQFDGVIVNLDEFETSEELEAAMSRYREDNIPIILAGKQMNLEHDPYIALSNGIIIENASLVSHGAQRARELGKGTLAGIKSKRLKTGTLINFNPQNRKISKINL